MADEGAPDFLLVEVPEQELAVVAPRHRLPTAKSDPVATQQV